MPLQEYKLPSLKDKYYKEYNRTNYKDKEPVKAKPSGIKDSAKNDKKTIEGVKKTVEKAEPKVEISKPKEIKNNGKKN